MKAALGAVGTKRVTKDVYQHVSSALGTGQTSPGAARLAKAWLRDMAPAASKTFTYRGAQLSDAALAKVIGRELADVGTLFVGTVTSRGAAPTATALKALGKEVTARSLGTFAPSSFSTLESTLFIDDGDSVMPSERSVKKLLAGLAEQVGKDATLYVAPAGSSNHVVVAIKKDGTKVVSMELPTTLGSFQD
ncbi:MAG: hypothetical protein JNG84_05010 [Archangium sp.]|nr:hypothetical protein [Archangium sp.]